MNEKNDRLIGAHEFQERKKEVETSSDRSFGLVFAGFFSIVGMAGFLYGGVNWDMWLGAAAVMAIVSLTIPRVLAPFNRVWTRLGLLLFMVVSPIVMAGVFYLCVTPIGLLLRIFGKDLLNLRWQEDVSSYWIVRAPPGPEPESLVNQF